MRKYSCFELENLPLAVVSTGYEGDDKAWCYWSAEYPDEGSCGPFTSFKEAFAHADEAGYRVEQGEGFCESCEVAMVRRDGGRLTCLNSSCPDRIIE